MGKLIKWGLQEVSGGMWLQKPILATTRGGAIFFQKKHVPGIWGRVLVILNSELMKILIVHDQN